MRLIDADALMQELEREVKLAANWKTAHEIANVVKYFPTIEPEQKHGRWIKFSPAGIYECSVCHQDVMTQDIDAYEFCHHCGCRMDGES